MFDSIVTNQTAGLDYSDVSKNENKAFDSVIVWIEDRKLNGSIVKCKEYDQNKNTRLKVYTWIERSIKLE